MAKSVNGSLNYLEREAAKVAIEKHMFYCDQCQEHVKVMTEKAMTAVHPEMSEVEHER